MPKIIAYPAKRTVKFPAHDKAPRLFLEWLSEYQFKHGCRATFDISIEDDKEEILNDLFVVKFDAIPPEAIRNLISYLQANLQDEG